MRDAGWENYLEGRERMACNTKAPHPEDVRLCVSLLFKRFRDRLRLFSLQFKIGECGGFRVRAHGRRELINATTHHAFESTPVKAKASPGRRLHGRRLYGCKALRGRRLKFRGLKSGFRLSAGTGCRGANIIFNAPECLIPITLFQHALAIASPPATSTRTPFLPEPLIVRIISAGIACLSASSYIYVFGFC